MRHAPIEVTLLALILASGTLGAQEAKPDQTRPTQDTFKLGEVTVPVTDHKDAMDLASTRVDKQQMLTFNRDTLGGSLDLLPGVNLSTNQRNEQIMFVRGQDARSVPLYLDGIPFSLPFEGQGDFGRLTTFNLAEVQVAKGFSSVSYGANTLGGAVNLVTRRPENAFDGDASLGAWDGQGRKATVDTGARWARGYVQVDGSYVHAGDFRMSSDFTPTPRENGGARDYSDFTNKVGGVKLGFTPNAQDEYVLGFLDQSIEKGQPIATDLSLPARYWKWPGTDKKSLYFTSNTALGAKSYVRFRAYHTGYTSTTFAYTDTTFTKLDTTPKNLSATGRRYYDDFAQGGILEFGTLALPSNSLRATVQTRTDVHREDDGTNHWKSYQDDLQSIGLEDSITLGERWSMALGAGYDRLNPKTSDVLKLGESKHFTNGQVGLFWRVAPSVQLYASSAQKDRFASLKDRYSLGQNFLQNPDLKPERALNNEVGAKIALASVWEFEAAVFQSEVRDLIQQVTLGTGNKAQSQNQNVGRVRNSGFEMAAAFKPSGPLQAGLTYMYLDRTNLSDPTIKLQGTPRNRLFGYLKLQPGTSCYLIASVSNQDTLWDTNSMRVPGFATTSLTAGWQVNTHLSFDGGFNNVLDRNYVLQTGFPMPGRTWFINARYRF